jgi:asparagine synthase (glutamine-hydrolysing)
MCGITGFTHIGGRFSHDQIYRATHSLVHRGPDEQRVWQSDNVSLGSRRLRVIDHDGGEQPMVSEDNDVILVFNGEIYNHRELRSRLEERGHKFRSACDTEVVLRAFMEWDVACLEKLRGMFAFAVWTESLRRLVLARDRMGIKPLYYAERGGNLYFGSELKAIFCHPKVDRSLDLGALGTYLSMNYVPGPNTLVESVAKIMPGTYFVWHDGLTSVGRYWTLPRNSETNASLKDSAAQLDELLKCSVREHLAADVPVGVWVSGGLDSSTVLHYASQLSNHPLKTFSITFNGREFDESRQMREVVEQYSTQHFKLDLNPESASADAINEFAYYADEPNADAGALPVWFLSKMSAKHVTVALSGEGADELFGGYLTYRADSYARYARLLPRNVRRLALRGATQLKASDEKIGFEYKLQRFLQGSLLGERASHVFWNGTFSQQEQSELLLRPEMLRLRDVLRSVPSHGDVRRFMAFDQQNYLPDNILTKVDRMSMAHSLEVRPPFLDHRIVEFAASLPMRHIMRGTNSKVILRELMKDKLPRSVISKAKIGLDIPVHDWFRGHLRSLLLDTLTQKAVNDSGLFHWPYIELLLTRHMQRKANYGYHLWGLLTLFLWMKRWNIETRKEIETAEEISTVSA